MPIHDWSRVDANLFHHFHQAWTMTICHALNSGLLPKGFSALVEQHAAGLVPDVLAVERSRRGPLLPDIRGGAVVTAEPPQTRRGSPSSPPLVALGKCTITKRPPFDFRPALNASTTC